MTSDTVVALAATGLRLLTVGFALVSVSRWAIRVPAPALLVALWGAAPTQLAYPAAETVVKLGILAGVIEPFGTGISNMSATGWFNFGAAWLIWDVPGVLFALAAVSYTRRTGARAMWGVLGAVGGIAVLAGLGLLLG